MRESASAAIEEYEKVLRVRRNTREQSEDVRLRSEKLLKEIEYRKFAHIHDFVKDLAALRGLRGEIIALRELRYRDDALIDGLEEKVRDKVQLLSDRCVEIGRAEFHAPSL